MTRALCLVGAGLLLLFAASATRVPPASAAFIDCPVLGVCIGTDDPDDMNGTDGYDEIRGKEGGDNLHGYGSGDDLYGGRGPDVLVGDGGDDAVHGFDGADELRIASDESGGDFADCGDGQDEVWADPGDAVSPDCEVVHIL